MSTEHRSHRLRIVVLLVAASLLAPTPSAADFGLGVIAGEPTGVSYKNWLSSRHAVDAAVAWSFVDEDALHVHADYLWHFFDRVDEIETETDGDLPLYVGVGGRIKFGDDDDIIGVRFPLGAAFEPDDVPLDFFLEIVPILELTPESDLQVNAAVGVRYWFRSE